VPRPPSKPTDPELIKAAVGTARQHLHRLLFDTASWSEQGIGPTSSFESRRQHAEELIRIALQPHDGDPLDKIDDDRLKKIAEQVALPILAQKKRPGTPSRDYRDQILVDAIAAVCQAHDLRPTRASGQAESGCSIVAAAIPEFITWVSTYSEQQLQGAVSPTRRSFFAGLPKRIAGLFPEGGLSEHRLNNLWKTSVLSTNK
jgi:hypothetical protein